MRVAVNEADRRRHSPNTSSSDCTYLAGANSSQAPLAAAMAIN